MRKKNRLAFSVRRLVFGEGGSKTSSLFSCRFRSFCFFFFCSLLTLSSFFQESAQAQGTNLIYNGDFEIAASQNPPPGWEMWGPKDNPAYNFSRDTENFHGGKAGLRIHHPAGSAGYLISSPANAVKPKKGKVYTLSFWARADKPGKSFSGFLAYEKINPYVDAPAPTYTFEVSREWKQYSFEIKEGFDFSADRSRYLMLVFRATTVREEEKTLWVDDVVVIEQDNPQAKGLIDLKSVVYKPLPHRLNPGTSLVITVDATKRLRPVNREISGISFHRLKGYTGHPYDRQGNYSLMPDMEQAIRDLRLPMTRIYGLGDEPFGFEGAIDRAAEVCKRTGIPMNRTVLEGEPYNKSLRMTPETWARGVRHAVQKSYPFRYWEVANEPEVSSRQGKKAAFPSPDDYIDHLKAVSKAIRKVQPKAQIGIPISDTPLWGSYILSRAAGHYDFVAGHYYGFINAYRHKFEIVTLAENYKILDLILRINELLRLYNPGKDVRQIDTEWGLHSAGPNNEPPDSAERNGNIYGTLHRAVRLIYYAREELLGGASSWILLSHPNEPGFKILSQDAMEKKSMLYWLYYYFNRHLGESVLDMSGTAPYYYPTPSDYPAMKSGEFGGPVTPALISQSKDGKTLYLVIANGSWERSVPCQVKVRNFPMSKAEGILLSQADPNGKALLNRKEDAVNPLPVTVANQEVVCTIPPHSVVFITVKK